MYLLKHNLREYIRQIITICVVLCVILAYSYTMYVGYKPAPINSSQTTDSSTHDSFFSAQSSLFLFHTPQSETDVQQPYKIPGTKQLSKIQLYKYKADTLIYVCEYFTNTNICVYGMICRAKTEKLFPSHYFL